MQAVLEVFASKIPKSLFEEENTLDSYLIKNAVWSVPDIYMLNYILNSYVNSGLFFTLQGILIW